MPFNAVEYSKWEYVDTLVFCPIIGLIKSSMILLYLRLGGAKRGVRIACWTLFWVNTAFNISVFVSDGLQCLPIEYNWNRMAMDQARQAEVGANEPGVTQYGPVPTGFKNGVYVAGGTCMNYEAFVVVSGGLGILTDIFVLLIPIYMVYDLQLKRTQKFLVIGILCLGIWYVQLPPLDSTSLKIA